MPSGPVWIEPIPQPRDPHGSIPRVCSITVNIHKQNINNYTNSAWQSAERWSRDCKVESHTQLRALGTELIPVSWQSTCRWHLS